jgi:hypothetical protein
MRTLTVIHPLGDSWIDTAPAGRSKPAPQTVWSSARRFWTVLALAFASWAPFLLLFLLLTSPR